MNNIQKYGNLIFYDDLNLKNMFVNLNYFSISKYLKQKLHNNCYGVFYVEFL